REYVKECGIEEEDLVEINIPAGVAEGMQLSVSGKGNVGPGGGPAGDLIVLIEEVEDEQLKRDGNNIINEQFISFPDAAMGTTIEVPTVDGKVKVKIEEILIDVFIGDKKLGTITEAADEVKIPKESAFDLPVNINVKTGPTVTKFFTEGTKMVVLGQKIKVDYKGYIKVKALGFIPVKVKIDQSAYFTLKDIIKTNSDTTHQKAPATKPQ
ncbi:MAG TPA: DnaJ C-terminal domain-containing protein, partial [Chitinophagales bacterium]|nr:DnaJ C-terminal domain-containing protein [Chitinophagales bacterium]